MLLVQYIIYTFSWIRSFPGYNEWNIFILAIKPGLGHISHIERLKQRTIWQFYDGLTIAVYLEWPSRMFSIVQANSRMLWKIQEISRQLTFGRPWRTTIDIWTTLVPVKIACQLTKWLRSLCETHSHAYIQYNRPFYIHEYSIYRLYINIFMNNLK